MAAIEVARVNGIELTTGKRRRRRWTLEEKAAILAESCQPARAWRTSPADMV